MAAVTAVPRPATGDSAGVIVVQADTAGTISRSDDSGRTWVTLTTTSRTVIDWDAPLNREVVYRLVAAGPTTVYAQPVTLTASYPHLTNTVDPRLQSRVSIVSVTDRTMPSQVTAHRVINRPEPVVVSAPLGNLEARLAVLVSVRRRDLVVRLLAPGGVIKLRSIDETLIPTGFYAITSEVSDVDAGSRNLQRVLTFSLVAVSRPTLTWDIPAELTYDADKAKNLTYADGLPQTYDAWALEGLVRR